MKESLNIEKMSKWAVKQWQGFTALHSSKYSWLPVLYYTSNPFVQGGILREHPWSAPLIFAETVHASHILQKGCLTVCGHPGHTPDTLGTLPDIASPARVIKMSHNNNSRTRKSGGFVA